MSSSLHPGALYLLGATYLTGDCVKQDLGSAMWCFQRASEKGHAGATIGYGSLLLRGVQVPEILLKFNATRGAAARKSRTGDECSRVDPVEMARKQFEIAAKARCDLGMRWQMRLEEEDKSVALAT
ncbi:hypothetical protein MLD38_006833 [Melastoma candidum]|uniref:Uncharacterized protein n=1 Tax=Melastoma candidum TaxID=119954 RepID=A0ACB9RNV5_9MYRT|nr:hypothetical protein MLD38_006833 [Melastoma candidum]